MGLSGGIPLMSLDFAQHMSGHPYKRVRIMTDCQPWWEYKTKSKTVFQIQIIDGEMKFFVIIPASRDKERRLHYNDLRIGNPYNGAVFPRYNILCNYT